MYTGACENTDWENEAEKKKLVEEIKKDGQELPWKCYPGIQVRIFKGDLR